MMKALLVLGVILSMFFALSASWVGGMLSSRNVSSDNLSALDIMVNISEATTNVRNSLNTTQTSGSTVQGFDLGGIWASIQLLFRMPELLSGVISGLALNLNFDTSIVVAGIMLLITTILGLKIIYFARSGSEV